VLVALVVATEVERHRSCSLQLELMDVGQSVDDSLRLLICQGFRKVVDVDTYVLVTVLGWSKPNVRFRNARLETKPAQAVCQPFVPPFPGCAKAIQRLVYKQHVALEVPEFGASYNVQIFASDRLQVCIADVCGPSFHLVKLGQEDKE
jgi:hypothetical protein